MVKNKFTTYTSRYHYYTLKSSHQVLVITNSLQVIVIEYACTPGNAIGGCKTINPSLKRVLIIFLLIPAKTYLTPSYT